MVRIITDSTADFEPEELDRMGIWCVPLAVEFGSAEYRENINLSKRMFYHLLEQAKDLPRTLHPSPYAFQAAFQAAQSAGAETLLITLSSALSETYQNAVQAKKQLAYDDCYIVDSLTTTAGQRILVEHAVKLRDAGMTAHEIAWELETLRSRITLYTCMDTVKYICKENRGSGPSYVFDAVAKIKPILHISKDGRAEIPARVIGIRKGIRYLCEKITMEEMDFNYPLYVMYAGNQRNSQLLTDALQELGLQIDPEHIVNIGAGIGTHVGPNAFGIAYVAKPACDSYAPQRFSFPIASRVQLGRKQERVLQIGTC